MVEQVVHISRQAQLAGPEIKLMAQGEIGHEIVRNRACIRHGVVQILFADIFSINRQGGGFQRVGSNSFPWGESESNHSCQRWRHKHGRLSETEFLLSTCPVHLPVDIIYIVKIDLIIPDLIHAQGKIGISPQPFQRLPTGYKLQSPSPAAVHIVLDCISHI